ncbi:hypothetical protein ES703_36638 [subsurface metagenome]
MATRDRDIHIPGNVARLNTKLAESLSFNVYGNIPNRLGNDIDRQVHPLGLDIYWHHDKTSLQIYRHHDFRRFNVYRHSHFAGSDLGVKGNSLGNGSDINLYLVKYPDFRGGKLYHLYMLSKSGFFASLRMTGSRGGFRLSLLHKLILPQLHPGAKGSKIVGVKRSNFDVVTAILVFSRCRSGW